MTHTDDTGFLDNAQVFQVSPGKSFTLNITGHEAMILLASYPCGSRRRTEHQGAQPTADDHIADQNIMPYTLPNGQYIFPEVERQWLIQGYDVQRRTLQQLRDAWPFGEPTPAPCTIGRYLRLWGVVLRPAAHLRPQAQGQPAQQPAQLPQH